ncbi:MAG TPA: LysM peptidoglycan-binding domain-containing protein [Candidatus Methylomirabilis sp.]|nr:LysM peptidoglycan-binding domain-containing protein [Candidatus Methylomirabilis sp.]
MPIDGKDGQSGDPLLTEAQELVQQAKRQWEEGKGDEAITLLTRARALLSGDGAPSPHREQLLEDVEALLDELAGIRAMHATPSEGEASLVSPEDEAALEKAFPPTEKPELPSDIPLEMRRDVQAYIELFTTTKRDLIAEALERSGRYLPLMRQIFAEKALPEDLVNLAYIESAFKLYAYSRARAVGLWQFIKGTGRKYGLRIDWWVDERRDPVKATAAAASYLSDLYGMFESWPLAIAAYNAGEGKVLRAIKRQRTTDFWKLHLPRETKYYVPAFMAMTLIAKNPEAYGFQRPREESWQLDQVALSQQMDLRLLAKAVGVSMEELRDQNPELNRLVTPPQEGYLLNLPPGSKAIVLDALDRLLQARSPEWRHHRVRSGEALSAIAQRYSTTVAVLMEMNGLQNPNQIRAGANLTVPVPALTLAETSTTKQTTNNRPASHYSLYVVKPGDSLWEIAKTHRVSPKDLERWNNLQGSLIHPGRTLLIYPD